MTDTIERIKHTKEKNDNNNELITKLIYYDKEYKDKRDSAKKSVNITELSENDIKHYDIKIINAKETYEKYRDLIKRTDMTEKSKIKLRRDIQDDTTLSLKAKYQLLEEMHDFEKERYERNRDTIIRKKYKTDEEKYLINIAVEGKTDEEIIRKAFAQNLIHFMKVNDVDRRDLEKDLNFKYSTIRDWTNEKALPRPEKIEQLAKYFNTTPAELMHGKKILYEFEETKKPASLTEHIRELSDTDIERELLITCTLLSHKQQKTVLEMIKSLLDNF